MISGRTTGESAVAATLTDLGDRWSIALSHPTRGTATVVLLKGMTSQQGSIAIGAQQAVPLHGGVQTIQVTTDGPQWETLPAGRVFYNGFEGN